MGQGTQTEEAGENIDAEGEDYIYMSKMLRLRKKNLLNLQILKMMNLNMTDVLYFPIFMCIVFHYTILKTVKLPLYLTHYSQT